MQSGEPQVRRTCRTIGAPAADDLAKAEGCSDRTAKASAETRTATLTGPPVTLRQSSQWRIEAGPGVSPTS